MLSSTASDASAVSAESFMWASREFCHETR